MLDLDICYSYEKKLSHRKKRTLDLGGWGLGECVSVFAIPAVLLWCAVFSHSVRSHFLGPHGL